MSTFDTTEANHPENSQGTSRQAQWLSAVHEASQAILSTLEMDAVLDLSVTKATELLDTQGALLLLGEGKRHARPEQQSELTCRAVIGPTPGLLLGQRLALGEGFASQVLQTGESLVVNEVQTDPRWPNSPEATAGLEAHSILCVPLLSQGCSIGVLQVINKQDHTPFDEGDVELLSQFASQVSIALQNAIQYEETKNALNQRLHELATIEEIDHELGSTLDYDRVITLVLQRAIEACRATSGMIGILASGSQQLDTRSYHYHKDETGSTTELIVGVWPIEKGIVGRVARTGEPDLIADVHSDTDYALVVPSSRSEVVVPIKVEDKVIGVLNLESDQPAAFAEDDLHFMEHLAEHAAIAIHKARLFERTDERLQARIDQLTALQRTSKELNATLAPDHILQMVLESAIQINRATHGNVVLRDRETGQLTLHAAQGYSDSEMAALKNSLVDLESNTIINQVLKSGQAQIVKTVDQEKATVCVRLDTQSALAVPIFYEGEIVGLINLRHIKAGAFDRDDLAFLQALAEQAAIAIGNAMRFEEQVQANIALRRQREQMDGLLEVSQKLRADVSLEDTLEEVAYAIQETVGYNLVLISVVENWESDQPILRRVAGAGLPLELFEEAKKVRQPLAQYEQILREEYRQGLCYFFPFQDIEHWGKDLHLVVSMPETEDWEEEKWHSHDMLLAPLRGAGERLLGYISVDEPVDGLRPSHRTLEALAIFANQAAVAVENSKLFADAQRRADNLALVNEVSRSLAQTLDPEVVLDTVVKGVGLLLECELGAIFQETTTEGTLTAVAAYGVPLHRLASLRFPPGEGPVGQVVASGRNLMVQDIDKEPVFGEWPLPIGSMILTPIMLGSQALGVLLAGSQEKHALTQADLVVLATLADQAAVALENTRLLASIQQAAMRLASLNEIGRQVAAKLELQDILDTTVKSLHQYLRYSRVGVFLIDEDKAELYAAAANEDLKAVIGPEYRLQIGQGLIGTTAVHGETVLVNDTAVDDRYDQASEWRSPASAAIPIKVADEVVGVLQVESDQPNAFTEPDTAALEIVADQLANAIEHARLFQQSQRRVAELATINEIGRAINSALDAEQLFELIYSQVSNLLDTRNFHVAFYDSEKELIHVEFLVEHGQRQPPVVLKPGQGLTSYLISTGLPILLSEGTEAFLQEHSLTLEREPATSWLGVPMIAEDQVIGAIAVQSFDQEHAFDADNLALLTTIAGQAAVAFQNASLFQQRTRRIAELRVLNRMAQAVSATLELDELLETVYRQVSQLMDATNFFIALYDEEKHEITFPFVVDPVQREDWSPSKGGEGLAGRIVATGEPLLLPRDAAKLSQEAGEEIVAKLCSSWLGVPMIAKGKVLGAIAVQSYEGEHVYDEGDLNLLSTVAAQAAVAVRNAQLYHQVVHFSTYLEEMVKVRTHDLEQALTELTLERDRVETLYKITSELGTSLELERVLQRALQLLADALGIQHGTITLVDQGTGQLDVQATLEELHWRHRKGERTPLKEGAGLAGWVLENRRSALVPDVSKDPRWMEIAGKELPIRSVVAAPLSLGGGDILGVLTLGHSEVEYFTEEHLQLVSAAASQVAIAVNNSDLYAFITDQAERVGSMLQAQQAEVAKNRAILESIADGVLVLDYKGRVLLVNPAAEEMLGFSAMAIQGEHFRHMLGLGVTATDRELAQALYTHMRRWLEEAGQDPTQLQMGTVRLESGKKVLAVSFAPLVVEAGGIPGLVAALRDMSREAEVERLKNEFISTVSHELRTPMTSIKGYTDLLFLGMAGGLSDAQRNFLQIIKSNADRLTALVNDILDISRIETGRLRLTIEPLDLGEIISQVVLSFQEQFREAELLLEWEEPKGMPQIRGDAARVTQVLNNLLANACHYTPAGGWVSVSLRQTNGFLRVSVEDTGIGIAADDIPRIFDRFYRVDDPIVREARGTGLGLSIAKMFIEMLGGEIWVESKLGEGTVFYFTLPVSTKIAEEGIQQVRLATSVAEAPAVRRSKVLIVENDRELALRLRRRLESEGHQVLLAGSGGDGLWLAREEQPQLIALDLLLPDMDGFTVLEQLKEHPLTAAIPVIILSVSTETDNGYTLGAVDYVIKPFNESELFDSILKAMSQQDEDRPGKLLAVDDDPDILSFLEQTLSYQGYQVTTATGGREALDQVNEIQPDLILLDLKMPGIDGYEVIRRLKAEEATRPIPIIVITASPLDKNRDKVWVLGMGTNRYATKPLSIEALAREIKTAVEQRQVS
jgi:PAS domain S-box-containing protein